MSSITISTDEVKRVAKLARVKLTEDEETKFASQLSPVMGHIDNLNTLDTSKTPSTAQVTSLSNVTREDIVIDNFTQVQSLSTAANISNGYFVMPKTIDK